VRPFELAPLYVGEVRVSKSCPLHPAFADMEQSKDRSFYPHELLFRNASLATPLIELLGLSRSPRSRHASRGAMLMPCPALRQGD
jgi:hypothetical protein